MYGEARAESRYNLVIASIKAAVVHRVSGRLRYTRKP